MKASTAQLRAAFDRADPAIRLYLLHGPDESGARALIERLARALGPDAERIDIDPQALKSDPARLATEAASLSLFGGRRYVMLSGIGDDSVAALTELLAVERAGNPVVAIAPTLKATSKAVKLALGSPAAMAHACYPPNAADFDRLAAALASEHGLRTTGRTATRLVAASGGDRAVLTREIEKIALYLDAAPDRPVALEDAAIDAIGADLGDAEIGSAVEAAIAGDAAALGSEIARLNEAGVAMVPVVRSLIRRLSTIAELRGEVDRGSTIDDAIERHKIFFKEKPATARALRAWSLPRLTGAIDHLRQAERAMMTSQSAGPLLCEVACLAVARAGRARSS